METYKIVTQAQWDEWEAAGIWTGAPIDLADGYIHMSTRSQVQETLDKHFTGQSDLKLVAYGVSQFGNALKWEVSRGGALFPHLYDTLPMGVARWVQDIPMVEGRAVVKWDRPLRTELAEWQPERGAKKALEGLGMKAVRALDPEKAHGVALKALHTPAVVLPGALRSDRLESEVCGMVMPNPVGLAAGFDKNAEAVDPLQRAGFGFIEVGAATPRPQDGNGKPRLFRLSEDQGVINRFGFNNEGMEPIADRLAARSSLVPVGLNLGANKDSADRAADFATVLRHCGGHVDFVTVNVSSPNTEKLRDLQGKDALQGLLQGVIDANAAIGAKVFLKIAPDLSSDELADVADVANALPGLHGIVATNTTLSRDGLKSKHRDEAGGLSGQPLFEKSTAVLARLSTLTDKPLIGVGGVSSGAQAYAKIKAGASAVQLYSGLVYGGLSLVGQIVAELDALVLADGYGHISQAIGVERERWL